MIMFVLEIMLINFSKPEPLTVLFSMRMQCTFVGYP